MNENEKMKYFNKGSLTPRELKLIKSYLEESGMSKNDIVKIIDYYGLEDLSDSKKENEIKGKGKK